MRVLASPNTWVEGTAVDQLHRDSLGTIGGGNHFAELQAVESIENAAACAALGVTTEAVYLCVHSGSRGLGAAILRDHVAAHGMAGG